MSWRQCFPTSARCCSCGKFFPHSQHGSSWVFVPDSYLSYEENRVRCQPCTKTLGRLTPNQNVKIEMCSGVINRHKGDADRPGEERS